MKYAVLIRSSLSSSWKSYAFLLLFAAEFTYYLLILQTGIVSYHHSALAEIWMVPAGGMAGIMLSVLCYKARRLLLPALLFLQLLLSVDYADANGVELFALGLISGLTAPMLLFQIDRLWVAVAALGLSYVFGTAMFSVTAIDRTGIALFLTLLALAASFFAGLEQQRIKIQQHISLQRMTKIFLWLLLDAALFETLSRDAVMHLWGNAAFTPILIVSHLIGLFAAYRYRENRNTDIVLLGLFLLAYGAYATHSPLVLSLVYPFVISYYNVAILDRLRRLGYLPLAVVSLSLWAASGLGLFIALSHTFAPAWAVLAVLAGITAVRSPRSEAPQGFSFSNLFKGYTL